MTKTTLEILKDARKLLSEKGWTQGTYSRDSFGFAQGLEGCMSPALGACFCGWGAVMAACTLSRGPWPHTVFHAKEALDATVPDGHFPEYNDAEGRTVEEVLAKFDEAIAAEEAKVVA